MNVSTLSNSFSRPSGARASGFNPLRRCSPTVSHGPGGRPQIDGVSMRRTQRMTDQRQLENAAAAADSSYTDKPLPNAFWRAFSALIYVIPAIDTFTLGTTVYGIMPQTAILMHVGGFFAPLYWSHQLVPLVVFFLLFLAIVKNKRLHHFVRFNGMQALMLDILVMLPTVAQAYIPAEIAWTVVGRAFQGVCFVSMFCVLTYAFIFTLAGKYADVPFISEAVYMQVHQVDLM